MFIRWNLYSLRRNFSDNGYLLIKKVLSVKLVNTLSLWRIDTNIKELMDKERYLTINLESNKVAENVGQNKYADMVRVGWEYGLRIHEVTRLDKNDLSNALRKNELTVKGKGGLVRSIPLHDVDLLKKLYNETPVGEKVFVKINEKTHHVINNFQNFIIRHQEKFAINAETNRSFHGLRHAYAQRRYQKLVESGYNDRNARIKVSRELGHFRIEITEIYLK